MDISRIDIVTSWSPRYLDGAGGEGLGPKVGSLLEQGGHIRD